MGILSVLKGAFSSKKVDLDARFEFSPKWIQGGGGRFHIVRQKSDGQTFGLKIIDAQKASDFRDRFSEKFQSEAELALAMQHENITKTLEIGFTKKSNEFILMEYVKGALLENLLEENPDLVRSRVLTFIRQLANAVQYIHESGFIHRDICPRNIWISADATKLRLFDFGLSVPDRPEFRQAKNRTGTPLYMAPEIVRRRETDVTVDIFAFGITIYQILSYQHPWGVEENSSKSALLFDSRPATSILNHLPQLDSNVANAIMSCLEIDKNKRCSSIKRFKMMIGMK